MNPAREVSSRGKRKAHPQIRNFTFLRRGLLSDEDFSKFFSILGKFYFKGKIKYLNFDRLLLLSFHVQEHGSLQSQA